MWPEVFPPSLRERFTLIEVLSEHTVKVEDPSSAGGAAVLKWQSAGDPDLAREALEGARVLAGIDHRGVAKLYDARQVDDEHWYLLSEFVQGPSLAETIASDGRPSNRDWTALGKAIAHALARVHDEGLLHRDLKPQNVILRREPGGHDWDPCLVDFGFAAAIQEDTGRTLGRQIVGTPRYMSPEQIRGDTLGPAADVYGLGLLLFEVLHGRSPFSGTSIPQVLQQVVNSAIDFPRPSNAFEAVAHDLLRTCLTADEQARPSARDLVQSIGELEVQLAKDHDALLGRLTEDESFAMGGVPTPSAATGTAFPVGEQLDERPKPLPPPSPPPSALGSRGVLILAAVLLTLSATAIVLSTSLSSDDPRAVEKVTWILALLIGGLVFFAGMGLSRWLHDRAQPERKLAESRAQAIVLGDGDPDLLSRSIAIAVDGVIERCRGLDERILALSMRAMLNEHRQGETSGDRRAALLDLVSLLEKVRHRVSPWYIRYERQLSFVIKATSAAAGVVGLVVAALKLAQ